MNVVGFAGFSGSGKTTLIEKLIPEMRQRGLRVSVVKHAHHGFDIDHPGKDTYRHREAGAFEVVAASNQRLALMREFETPMQLSVHQLLAELYEGVDWVFVEGFKDADIPKIELLRQPDAGSPPADLQTAAAARYPTDNYVVALVTHAPDSLLVPSRLPQFDRDAPAVLADWLVQQGARFDYSWDEQLTRPTPVAP